MPKIRKLSKGELFNTCSNNVIEAWIIDTGDVEYDLTLLKFHRKNGPAVRYTDADVWFEHGKIHRKRGPAIIYKIGGHSKSWYKHGKLHRENGPAIEWTTEADGRNKYYLDDVEYTKKDYYKELHKRGLITDEDLFLRLL